MKVKTETAVTLVFPFPPSVNTMYMQGKNHGQKFPTKKTKEYKKAVASLHANFDKEPMKGHVQVTTVLVPPDTRARDVDNYQKALLDGLTDLKVFEDDSQIRQINAYMLQKDTDYNKGYAIVTVAEIELSAFETLQVLARKHLDRLVNSSRLSKEQMLSFIKPTKKNGMLE